ncbi:Ig-like domain-containing protein [Pseudomonas sp. 51_B]|uniref:Ig-like domain-containing protein n=1 Tax=Pseudomonas sp. 51_B TaxID=2813573 RepID=UPI00325FA390
MSGRGEAGSTVNVFDPAGNLIGTGTVGSDGTFTVDLGSQQNNGQGLTVTITDPAGNTSTGGTVTAPDTTAPTAARRSRNATGTEQAKGGNGEG